jgi:hypothetical protein
MSATICSTSEKDDIAAVGASRAQERMQPARNGSCFALTRSATQRQPLKNLPPQAPPLPGRRNKEQA